MFHLAKKQSLLFGLLLGWPQWLLAAPLTLNDVLHAAMEKHSQSEHLILSKAQIEQPADSWLASPPTVSLLYWHNQQSAGAKEAEISLNLAIKSRLQTEIDQQLRRAGPLIQKHVKQQQALFLSGLIRFTVWEYKLQSVYTKQAEQKLKVLTRLLSHYELLAKAGNTPSYLTLLVKQETIQSRLALLEHQSQANSLLSDYYALTGLRELPDNVNETQSNLTVEATNQHPDIAVLDASWQLYISQLAESSQRARPWHVSINAKQTDTPGFSENQIGVGLEIPLPMASNYTHSQYSDFAAARSQYSLQRDKLLQQIQQSINAANAQLTLSKERQHLLDEALKISVQLQPTLDELLASNIADQEWIVRRSLEIVDTQAQFATNQINLHKHTATLNQAAGKSL